MKMILIDTSTRACALRLVHATKAQDGLVLRRVLEYPNGVNVTVLSRSYPLLITERGYQAQSSAGHVVVRLRHSWTTILGWPAEKGPRLCDVPACVFDIGWNVEEITTTESMNQDTTVSPEDLTTLQQALPSKYGISPALVLEGQSNESSVRVIWGRKLSVADIDLQQEHQPAFSLSEFEDLGWGVAVSRDLCDGIVLVTEERDGSYIKGSWLGTIHGRFVLDLGVLRWATADGKEHEIDVLGSSNTRSREPVVLDVPPAGWVFYPDHVEASDEPGLRLSDGEELSGISFKSNSWEPVIRECPKGHVGSWCYGPEHTVGWLRMDGCAACAGVRKPQQLTEGTEMHNV